MVRNGGWLEVVPLPEPLIRLAAGRALKRRLKRLEPDPELSPAKRGEEALDSIRHAEVFDTEGTALQRGNLPFAFWRQILGSHLHAGAAFWPRWAKDIDTAELEWLQLVSDRARLHDGQRVLEIGGHLGSVGRWAASTLSRFEVTLVAPDEANRKLLAQVLDADGPASVTLAEEPLSTFKPKRRWDRILLIEALGWISNPASLLETLTDWLEPGGLLFVQTPCHWRSSYRLEAGAEHRWMIADARDGAILPGEELVHALLATLPAMDRWELSGEHAERTARAWRARFGANREALDAALASAGVPNGSRVLRRWRNALLAQEAQFGLREGQEWCITQLLLSAGAD